MELIDREGERKYLSIAEREAFRKAAEKTPRDVRTFCLVLYYTGCRLSDALALTPDRIDFEEGTLTFETLKRRKQGIFRSVPVPSSLLEALDLVHGLREQSDRERKRRIWNWSRSTAWRRVKEVMDAAGLEGIKATPKGLRHGFGIACNQKEVQLNMAQKWLGHANIKTTAIYSNAVGKEERNVAQRLWETTG